LVSIVTIQIDPSLEQQLTISNLLLGQHGRRQRADEKKNDPQQLATHLLSFRKNPPSRQALEDPAATMASRIGLPQKRTRSIKVC
jgi:hypothetical protein